MVQQFNQNNINSPRGSVLFDADATLDLDDDLVVVTTAAGPVTLTLPTASQIPGQEIKIKANDAGSTGNAVTIAAAAGENIDGNASTTLTTDQGSICLKSDGSNWRLTCTGDGSSNCCPPQLLAPTQIGFTASPLEFQLQNSQAGQTVNFNAAECGLDEPLVAKALQDPSTAPGTLPLITDISVIAAFGDNPPRVSIEFDTTNGASGNFILQVTNDCGCCTILYGEVEAA
jgi:hypothetical protein